jgi:hypothetical protein
MAAVVAKKNANSTVRRLIKREGNAGEGGADAPVDSYPLVLTVAGNIKLVQVMPSTPAHLYPSEADSIFCLGIGDGQFTIDESISWVRSALTKVKALSSEARLPIVVVLGNIAALTKQELTRVSTELLGVGAYFVKWPPGCASFEEAFRAFRDELAQNYGPVDQHESEHQCEGQLV